MTSDIIHHAAEGWQPIERAAGLPLRVAVYNEIGRAIRSGLLQRGESIPRESDLCELFAVSRTVAREALILLEEDGLVRTKRGIGRFVAEELPAVGLERVRPFEDLFSASDSVVVKPLAHRIEAAADFTQRIPEAQVLFVESAVVVEDEPVALLQEWAGLEWLRQRVPEVLDKGSQRGTSLLAEILTASRSAVTSARSDFTASHAGEERSKHLNLRARDPVLLISQVLETAGGPCYLAKAILGPNSSHITINQSAQ